MFVITQAIHRVSPVDISNTAHNGVDMMIIAVSALGACQMGEIHSLPRVYVGNNWVE